MGAGPLRFRVSSIASSSSARRRRLAQPPGRRPGGGLDIFGVDLGCDRGRAAEAVKSTCFVLDIASPLPAAQTGALLTGRRTYDLVNGWGGSRPIRGLPVVVLAHVPPATTPKGESSFAFWNNVQKAVDPAKRQSGERDVIVHGASITRQLLAARLADEPGLHIAPLACPVRLWSDSSREADGLQPAT